MATFDVLADNDDFDLWTMPHGIPACMKCPCIFIAGFDHTELYRYAAAHDLNHECDCHSLTSLDGPPMMKVHHSLDPGGEVAHWSQQQ